MQRLITAFATLIAVPAGAGAATLYGASGEAQRTALHRQFDLRLVQTVTPTLIPVRSSGAFVETSVMPNARLQLGLLKSRVGDGVRAPKSRKVGLSFKMQF